MEVPLEGSSSEEESGHGHVGIDPGSLRMEMQQAHKSHLLKKSKHLMEGLTHQGSSTLLRKVYTDLYIIEGGRGNVNNEHEVRQIERASWREAAEDRPIKCSGIFESLSEQVKDLAMEVQRSSEQDKPIGFSDIAKQLSKKGEASSQQVKALSNEGQNISEQGKEVQHSSEQAKPTGIVLTKGVAGIGKTVSVKFKALAKEVQHSSEQDKPIGCIDIVKRRQSKKGEASSQEVKTLANEGQHSSEQVKPIVKSIGIVLTKGVAGIGKTVSVQKFILDWAEGTTNQDVDFIFPLPFRELNLMKEKHISLVDLISCFFSDIKDPRVFTNLEDRVMFIFDGLDECRLPLNFQSNPECCDVNKSVPVDVLLTNLMKGKLLPSALIWITTRPAAAHLIPPECVNQVTEIQGFNDPQKEEYFRKKLSDENLASRTIAHLKSYRSLYIMCYIPIFSWISATVVERTSGGPGSIEIPRTLTQMYTHFLIIQVRNKNTKYTKQEERDEEMIFKLGKLAFQQFERGNLIFYEEDLRKCGIDVTEASVYSGVCTQIFREEAGLYQVKVFSFVHLSIQEFLAALYVFLCFVSRERIMPNQQQKSQLSDLFRAATLHDLHKITLDLALQSKNGHLDLFLRFLLGLSLESNQNLVRHLLPQTSGQSQSSEQTVQLVKQKIRGQRETDRGINLFYCLNELNQHAVVEHIDRSSKTLTIEMLLPGQWKTGKFEFETSEEYLDGFNLQKYIRTPEMDQTELLNPGDVLQKLISSVVFTSSTSAQLFDCPLSGKSCTYLASALTSHSSCLTQLQLQGPGRKSSSLCLSSSSDCNPWELSVQNYNLTEEICSHLVPALTSHISKLNAEHLRQEEEVDRLCCSLSHQDSGLETLKLYRCTLSVKSCSYLASALTSYSSHLTQLMLRNNNMQDSGMEHLSSALCHPNCKLETLELDIWHLSEKSCSCLASALTSHASHLTQLQLTINNNNLQDSVVEPLYSAICHSNCKLQTLLLDGLPLSEKSCSYLVSALTSHSSRLTQLWLVVIIPDTSAAEKLIALGNDPHYQVGLSYVRSKRGLHLSGRVLKKSEVTTPSAHHQQQSHGQRRICESCADIQDPGHWCVMLPSISLERGEIVYNVSSAAGSYECSESGLRWTCAGPVTLQYRISKEELFWAQLQMLGYRPAGPLLEIKLLSGELEEAHLPHSLCLGGSDLMLLGDAVRALHGDDSGVSLETCELSRFHGRLSAQDFSLWQMVVRWLFPSSPSSSSSSSSVKDHCEVLIREHCPWPLVLHTYLLPSPSSARQWVENKGGRFIDKPSPVHSLCIDSTVQLHTSPDSLEIMPSELTFNYRNPPTTFFEVYLENRLPKFKMEIKTAENQTVWEAMLRLGVDYSQPMPESNKGPPQQPSRTPVEVGSLMAAAFLEEKRPKLIQRVTEVMPIIDQLLSQRIISQETYNTIQAAATSQDKIRLLFDGLRSAGDQGKLAFYNILQEQQPHLVEELWTAR